MLVCPQTLIRCERDCGTKLLCKRAIEARVERERKGEHQRHEAHHQSDAEVMAEFRREHPEIAAERDLKGWWC